MRQLYRPHDVSRQHRSNERGFTIVELLIVIVVIGILAAITIVSYNGVQKKAQQAKIKTDFASLSRAVYAAQVQTGGPLKDILLDSNVNGTCMVQPAGTDLASLPQSHACWVRYNAALDKLSIASGANVRGLVDPWGRPYWIDSNEAELSTTDCRKDELALYAVPYNGTSRTDTVWLPLVTSACA